jgi:pyruvate carboxylase subunit B
MPSPEDSYDLFKALKQNVKIPVGIHTHYNSGMASMACYKAIEAGADIIDTASGPFALRSSFPATEVMAFALKGTPRDPGYDIDRLVSISSYLETVIEKYTEWMDKKINLVDINAIVTQIPGGMLTNLLFQLRQLKAENRLAEVVKEIPQVRKEFGYPPMATPASQIIVAQSVQNVLCGRYKIIPRQVKDYFYGLYGKSPFPIDTDIQKTVLAGYDKGPAPITCRPADMLEPEMDKAREALAGITQDMGDILIYAINQNDGMRFLKNKYGVN